MLVRQSLPCGALHGVELFRLQGAYLLDALAQVLAAFLQGAIEVIADDMDRQFQPGGDLRRGITRKAHIDNPSTSFGNHGALLRVAHVAAHGIPPHGRRGAHEEADGQPLRAPMYRAWVNYAIRTDLIQYLTCPPTV